MANFKSNLGDYDFHIAGSVKPFTDPKTGREGSIQFDVYGPNARHNIFANVVLQDVLDALNQIPGVKATYEEPSPASIPVPLGLGAVVGHPRDDRIRVTRVRTGPGKNWVQNLSEKGLPAWYTDAQVEVFLNIFHYVVLSEGV